VRPAPLLTVLLLLLLLQLPMLSSPRAQQEAKIDTDRSSGESLSTREERTGHWHWH
jgi:hypothetical protein